MATAAGPLTTLERDGVITPLALAAVKVFKGAAAAVVIGTGFGTPLLPANATHQFVGVYLETYDNTAGTAGGYFTRIKRKGAVAFGQTGTTITAAYIGKNAYFADDNTVTLTAGTTFAGTICAVDVAGNVWVDIEQAVRGDSSSRKNFTALGGATDAVNPHVAASYIVLGAPGVDAMTLAAPTAGVDDGLTIILTSGNAHAHTLTATSLLNTGSANVSVATFAAFAGAGLTLVAYQGKWNVVSQIGITFT